MKSYAQHLTFRIAGEGDPGAIRSSISGTPRNTFSASHRWLVARAHFRGDPAQVRLDSLLATLRAHGETCEEAGQCAEYIGKNRSHMH